MLAVAAVAVVAGCGGGEDASPASVPAVDEVVGRAPPAVAGLPSIVLLGPLTAEGGAVEARTDARRREGPMPGSGTIEDADGLAVMDQSMMAFAPEVLVVPPGSVVRFQNSEDVSHSVEVRAVATDSLLFSEATDRGLAYEHDFPSAGAYDVSCPIHPGMRAFILVDPARFHAVAEPDGSFRLEGVPPGRYRARVWSRRPGLRVEREVEIGAGRTELSLVGAPPAP